MGAVGGRAYAQRGAMCPPVPEALGRAARSISAAAAELIHRVAVAPANLPVILIPADSARKENILGIDKSASSGGGCYA